MEWYDWRYWLVLVNTRLLEVALCDETRVVVNNTSLIVQILLQYHLTGEGIIARGKTVWVHVFFTSMGKLFFQPQLPLVPLSASHGFFVCQGIFCSKQHCVIRTYKRTSRLSEAPWSTVRFFDLLRTVFFAHFIFLLI